MDERDKIIEQIANDVNGFIVTGECDDWVHCGYCLGSGFFDVKLAMIDQEIDHEDDCVWIRSKELTRELKIEKEYSDRLQNDKDIRAALNRIKESE